MTADDFNGLGRNYGKDSIVFDFLLKTGVTFEQALKPEHLLEEFTGSNLPSNSKLFVMDSDPRPPWWKDYFRISENLDQVSKGAILFLQVQQRTFAITFGRISHNLNDEMYEYDFGLKITLNTVDHNALKSTDILEPGSSRRRVTQIPDASNLTYFDFDHDTMMVKSLAGAIKNEYKDFFGNATGSSSVRLSSKVKPSAIPGLCEKLLELYKDESYKENFPDIHDIEPVKDPQKIHELNQKLLETFREKDDKLFLTVPHLLDYDAGFGLRFTGGGSSKIYPDLVTSRYYEYLENNSIALSEVTTETLKKHKIELVDDDDEPFGKSYSILRCISTDVKLSDESETYHINEGEWYKVKGEYIKRLNEFVDNYFELHNLLPYQHESENKYNRDVFLKDPRFICLDQTDIRPAGTTGVEPCDLYLVEAGEAIFYHVKVSTRSSHLSHLFNQGLNATELIKSEPTAELKLRQLIKNKIGNNDEQIYLEPINKRNYKVIYAIVTKKDPSAKSANLPLFSKISLRKSIKSLTIMEVGVACVYIEDKRQKRQGRAKKRKLRQLVQ